MTKKQHLIRPEDIRIETIRGAHWEEDDICTPEAAMNLVAELTIPIANDDEKREQLAVFEYLLSMIVDHRRNDLALTVHEAGIATYAFSAGWGMHGGHDITEHEEIDDEDFSNLLREIRQPK